MTTVVFTLKGLDGVPIPNTAFTITAGLPDEVYDPEVVVPPKQTFITDALGVATVELVATAAPYYMAKATQSSDDMIAYKFFVPESSGTLVGEMLYVDLGLHQRLLNDRSLLSLIETKVSVTNAANLAIMHATSVADAVVTATTAATTATTQAGAAATQAMNAAASAVSAENSADAADALATSLAVVVGADNTVALLVGYSPLENGMQFHAVAYHSDYASSPQGPQGGGLFIWSATTPKSSHNGGTIISPTVPWDGNHGTHEAFLLGTGETTPAGNGCWLRMYKELTSADFGTVGEGTTIDDAPALRAFLNFCVSKNAEAKIPAGKYLLNSPIRLTNIDRLTIRGSGSNSTILKRGDNVITTSFTEMLTFRAKTGGAAKVNVHGLTFDGNARGNPAYFNIQPISGTFQVGESLENKDVTISEVGVNTLKFNRYMTDTLSGELITGATSGATAIVSITDVNPTTVDIESVVGTFQVGESLVGRTAVISEVKAGSLKFSTINSSFTGPVTITGATSGATAVVTTKFDAYEWEQSHCMRFDPLLVGDFETAMVSDIQGYDPTADVINFSGGAAKTHGDIMVSDVVCTLRNRVRSDINITGSYRSLEITRAKVNSMEIELNSYNSSLPNATVLSDIITRNLDLAAEGSTDVTGFPSATLTNIQISETAFLCNFNAIINGCRFALNSGLRFVRGKWSMKNCAFVANNGFTETKLVYYSANGTNPRKLDFSNCEFSMEGTGALTRYFEDDNSFGSSYLVNNAPVFTTQEPVNFTLCVFKGSTVRSAYFRSGKFVFDRCRHEYAGAAILQSTTSAVGIANELTMSGNLVSDASGWLYEPPIAFSPGAPIKIWMSGNLSRTLGQLVYFTRYDKIAPPHGAAAGINAVLEFQQIDREFESGAEPTTGSWMTGMIVWNSAAAAAGKVGWVVTTSGTAGSGAVFKPFGLIDA